MTGTIRVISTRRASAVRTGPRRVRLVSRRGPAASAGGDAGRARAGRPPRSRSTWPNPVDDAAQRACASCCRATTTAAGGRGGGSTTTSDSGSSRANIAPASPTCSKHMMFQGSQKPGQDGVQSRWCSRTGGPCSNGLDGGSTSPTTSRFVPANTLETMPVGRGRTGMAAGWRVTQDKPDQPAGRGQERRFRVNVLNRPYGGFPWLDHAAATRNKNWHKRPQLLRRPDRPRPTPNASPTSRRFFHQYYTPQQRRAGGVRRDLDYGPRPRLGSRSTSPASRAARPRPGPTRPHRAAAGPGRIRVERVESRSPTGRRSRSPTTCRNRNTPEFLRVRECCTRSLLERWHDSAPVPEAGGRTGS